METLASEIAYGKASRELLERARQVAEAQIDLRRVQYARYQLLSGGLEDPPYEPPIANSKPQGQHKSAAILSQELKKWLAMDWYERRALSRRKPAIRDFDEARRQAVAPGGNRVKIETTSVDP